MPCTVRWNCWTAMSNVSRSVWPKQEAECARAGQTHLINERNLSRLFKKGIKERKNPTWTFFDILHVLKPFNNYEEIRVVNTSLNGYCFVWSSISNHATWLTAGKNVSFHCFRFNYNHKNPHRVAFYICRQV